MPLIPLKFRPGVTRDLTDYSGVGGWYDVNLVRFRAGLPEKMGGWAKSIATAFLGVCRSLIQWSLLDGRIFYGLGTNLKYYVSDTSSYTDVTPLRTTTTLGANPFTTTNGDTTVLVAATSHGAVTNDFVTFSGATGGFAGLVAADLNQEFQITVVDANSYTIVLGVTPNASTSGGGAAVSAAYQINTGSANATVGLGWGTGTWGRGTWGSDATNGVTLNLRIWSADTFGQDLITCVRNGGIYHWDATNPTDRMVALDALVGESDAPTIASVVKVSSEEAHTVAFGCNPLGTTTQDPMFVRWADTESYLDWTPTPTNTAGGYRLSVGTTIIAAVHGRGAFLIWTDIALYTMTWTGPPYTFSFQLVGYNIAMLGPNAAITANDVTFWMGESQFYLYDGRVQVMPCTITDYIFTRINTLQAYKTYAFTNSQFNEVGWLYTSINSANNENDSYVIYNYVEQAWYYGMIPRTAWLDVGLGLPLATSDDSFLYTQEFGFDDGSTNPATALNSYIESSPVEVPAADGSVGDHFLFMDRIIPDVTFRNSTADVPTVTMTLKTQDYPGGVLPMQSQDSSIQSSSATITQFTPQAYVRLRGRSAVFRCGSDTVGVTWRLGVPRVSYRPDGRR